MYLPSHATQEVEIRRIEVPGQSQAKRFARPPSQQKKAGHSDIYLSSQLW
jgi:hypothetical protein